VAETDLAIYAERDLRAEAEELIRTYRWQIRRYAERVRGFYDSFRPLPMRRPVPPIVREMSLAARRFGVGPMAAVAGAIAERVGRDLLRLVPEVIVENGGDIFLKTRAPCVLAVYAGKRSPLKGRLRFRLPKGAWGVCTSSGTVGHSVSFGKADAVVAVARSAALADAAATAIGNVVKSPDDVARVLDAEKRRKRLDGLVIVIGRAVGLWGRIELVD